MTKDLTAIIIAKNEEKMIEGCLKSLGWVGEIVLVDTGSTDKTVQIAKKYKARVVSYISGKSFSEWRNKGLSEAKTAWVLYIDADERVTPELAREIDKAIKGSYVSYAIPRKNIVFGKELHHGGWWPDYVKRLFLKDTLTGWFGELHEEPVFDGEMGHLENAFIHKKHETLSEMVEKTNDWSEIEARLMFEANHPPMNIPRFVSAAFREFWKRMVVNKAFMDGPEGIIMAMYQVYSRFVSYAKLWEMQERSRK